MKLTRTTRPRAKPPDKTPTAIELKATAYHLRNLGFEYDPDVWLPENNGYALGDIIEFATALQERLDSEPELIAKIKRLPPKPSRFLKKVVPGWAEFAKTVEGMKPRMHPDNLLQSFDDLRGQLRDDIADAVDRLDLDENDIQDAWTELSRLPQYARTRKAIARRCVRTLRDLADAIENTFGLKGEEPWPREWMLKNQGIKSMLIRCHHFVPIMNYLTNNALSLDECQYVMEQRNIKARDIPLFLPKLNYEAMAGELGISVPTAKRYVVKFKEAGILAAFHGDRRHWQDIYSLGYWQLSPVKRKIFYLSNTPHMRKALKNFKLFAG